MATDLTRRSLLAATPILLSSHAAATEPRCLETLLRRRHMVRKFGPGAVSDVAIGRLIDAARVAPSAGNTEPWTFVVVRDAEQRKKLAAAALGQSFVATAPVVLVPCADRSRPRPRYGNRGDRYALIDTAFASMLLLLAVVEEGLGACFVGAFDDAEVSRLLGLPEYVQPLAVVPIGVPAEKPRAVRRRPRAEIVRQGRW